MVATKEQISWLNNFPPILHHTGEGRGFVMIDA